MITLILTLVIAGVILYFVENFLPMDASFKLAIRAIVLICLLLYVLQAFGLIGGTGLHLRN